jgi:hypothetical protein
VKSKKEATKPINYLGYSINGVEYHAIKIVGSVQGSRAFVTPSSDINGAIILYTHDFAVANSMGTTGRLSKSYLSMDKGRTTVVVQIIGFRKRMSKLFADSPEIVAKIQSREYNYNNYKEMAKDYNNIMAEK